MSPVVSQYHAADDLIVVIALNETGNPPGKLADAELHFTSGSLAGLKIVGVGVWQRRESATEINVTMPSRSFQSGGERRSFSLVRIDHDLGSSENKREYYAPLNALQALVIRAYQEAVTGGVETAPPREENEADEVNADDIPF